MKTTRYMGHDTMKMTFSEDHGDWNYGFCENCMKNAGDKVVMVREKIEEASPKFFVCPQCGSTKRL